MIRPQKVQLNPDPMGSFTVQVFALNQKGELIIGNSGGVPAESVDSEVTRIIAMLDRAQTHTSAVFKAKEAKTE